MNDCGWLIEMNRNGNELGYVPTYTTTSELLGLPTSFFEDHSAIVVVFSHLEENCWKSAPQSLDVTAVGGKF